MDLGLGLDIVVIQTKSLLFRLKNSSLAKVYTLIRAGLQTPRTGSLPAGQPRSPTDNLPPCTTPRGSAPLHPPLLGVFPSHGAPDGAQPPRWYMWRSRKADASPLPSLRVGVVQPASSPHKSCLAQIFSPYANPFEQGTGTKFHPHSTERKCQQIAAENKKDTDESVSKMLALLSWGTRTRT